MLAISAADPELGGEHLISTDQLRADLRWLQAQELVRVDEEPFRSGALWMVQLLMLG